MKRDRSHEHLRYTEDTNIYISLPLEMQDDLRKIAHRIPGMDSGPHFHVMRMYGGYEWRTALQFLFDYAMQFDRLVESSEYGLRALHTAILDSDIQMIEDETTNGFVILRYMHQDKCVARMFVQRNGMRTFECSLFCRTDCTLQERF